VEQHIDSYNDHPEIFSPDHEAQSSLIFRFEAAQRLLDLPAAIF
jgi:hypothetical protein